MKVSAYTVEPKLFEMFPAFKRGVLIATGIDNNQIEPETSRLLLSAAYQANHDLSVTEQSRIDVWNAAYLRLGTNPNRFTPSIRFLLEQIQRGRNPRAISKLVDIFNIISLQWITPCGGDDLESLGGGDLCLGLARGDETFAPLFNPAAIEHPTPGEVIYYTMPSRRVLCRRWTWRNSDFSKIRQETTAVAINIDMMIPPFTKEDLERALGNLSDLVRQFCGADISTHILEQSNPEFAFKSCQ
jgi:DNA/RNA-binding domain of Phe-tRNA-synthetase-like protein